MREVIALKDVRAYMEKRGKKLTDFNRTTRAYNYSGIGFEEAEKDFGHDTG